MRQGQSPYRPALVAVMVLVSVGTFDWHSVKPPTLKRMPIGETVVMAVTTVSPLRPATCPSGPSPARSPPW
ncbi:hypothetical protein SCOCK_300048 [Actinacidiphila cocklensis]|uniref:Uncharacterized protein n=1 Tax=Actinacidiphila cocklensis TaxID=887465 RepID=A0A9W4GSE3_9ACTN|nr:hypothetical protein SCOCK_300048 [Actinacidiphila cocklensis]